MPQLTPKNPHQAAQQYAATLRSGCTLGAIDLSFLRELATLSPELRHQLGVYFGIIERDESPAEVRLPQLRKQVPGREPGRPTELAHLRVQPRLRPKRSCGGGLSESS